MQAQVKTESQATRFYDTFIKKILYDFNQLEM